MSAAPAPARAAPPAVSVVLITTDAVGSAMLATLDALIGQATALRRVLIVHPGPEAVDLTGHRLFETGDIALLWLPHASLAAEDFADQVGPAIQAASTQVPHDPNEWLWILPDDARPAFGALAALLSITRASSRVGILGPKLVQPEDARLVRGLGHRVTAWGAPVESMQSGAWDQGQYDELSDVIGVPIAGMLVRVQVWAEAGGLESAFPYAVQGLDLSWRAHLLGHRVLVAPEASVAQGDRGIGVIPAAKGARASALVALARGSKWRTPLRAVAMVLIGCGTALVLLLLRRPRAAALAWAPVGAVLAPRPAILARRRFRRPGTVTERDLRGLFAPHRAARAALGAAESAEAERSLTRKGNDTVPRALASIESGPTSEDSSLLDGPTDQNRWWSWPLVGALIAALVVTAATWRDLRAGLSANSWGLRGSEILPVRADAAAVWEGWWLPWSGASLGQTGQGPPWMVPMSGLTWLAQHLPGGPTGAQAAGVATAWLLLLAIPLSLLIAYRSTREVVGSRAVCAILALGWASAPPLLSGLDSGRVGPVVVHLLAPPIIVGVLLSLRPGHRGTSAAWLAALLTAVAAWFVPAMVLLGAVAGVVVALGARRWSRLRGVPLALLPLALLGPQVLTVVADPVLIFGGAGASAASVDSLAAWQALLLHPGGAVPLTLWWIAPAWILAFAAVVQRSAPTRSAQASGLLVTALVGAAAAVAASLGQLGRLPTGYAEAQLPLTPWPGTFLSVAGAALLIAAGLGATEVLSAIRSHSPRHAVLGALGVMLMAVAAAGSLGTMAWQGTQSIGGSLAIAQEPLPAIVAERAEGPDQLRILQLAPITASPDSAYTVDYRLQSAEPARWLSDRTWDLAQASAAGPEEHQVTADASHALAELVADVVDTDPATGADQTSLEGDLADLAVGFVQVDASADHPLVAQVDRVPSLVRVSSATDVALWRVLPDVAGSRVWVQAPDGAALGAVSSQGPHGRTRAEIPQFAPGEGQDAAADGSPMWLVVAQSRGWSEVAQVSVGGQGLLAEPGFPLRYRLPAVDGPASVDIDLPTPHRFWWWSTLGLAVLASFFALPTPGSRRSRRT